MIAIDGIVITEKMRAVGEKTANDAIVVHCKRQLNKEIDWSIYGSNSDLLQKYYDRDLVAVEMIYIAMERARQ